MIQLVHDVYVYVPVENVFRIVIFSFVYILRNTIIDGTEYGSNGFFPRSSENINTRNLTFLQIVHFTIMYVYVIFKNTFLAFI